eukprot:1139050-Pelagomonas_calceolata.AAC.2
MRVWSKWLPSSLPEKEWDVGWAGSWAWSLASFTVLKQPLLLDPLHESKAPHFRGASSCLP